MNVEQSAAAMVSEKRGDLEALVEEAGLDVGSEDLATMIAHLALVLDKNQVMNLTRITSVDDALVLHILDSLLLLPAVEKTDGPVLDIGTGAGYPGIPLAVATGRPFTLMDSVGKKARAVKEFAHRLDLGNVETTSERAEAFAVSHGRSYGAVVARAVAPLGVLVEYAQPLLTDGGSLVVSKGRLGDDELAAGNRTAAKVGMELVSRETCGLPRGLGHREILTYNKVAPSSVPLPRPVGEAKNHPLA